MSISYTKKFKKYTFVILFSLLGFCGFAQETHVVSGVVLNSANNLPIENVSVVNLNEITGTSTNEYGEFTIRASINDTLFFTRLAFETLRVRVTSDWIKYGGVKIKLTEMAIALEEVLIQPVKLTGYLEVDAKNIPNYTDFRYSISGLSSAYEGGDSQPGGFSKVLNAIFNPVDMLYQVFGKKPQQMRKLKKMRKNDAIRNLLQQKFDRETLVALLGLSKVDINEILRRCEYSKSFIENANDLQILDAISQCYEEYKALNPN